MDDCLTLYRFYVYICITLAHKVIKETTITNTMNPVLKKIKVKVTLTKEQIALIKNELIGSGLIYQALYYADIHYNTLFNRGLKGKPIKKEQRDKLMEFCAMVKQEKGVA